MKLDYRTTCTQYRVHALDWFDLEKAEFLFGRMLPCLPEGIILAEREKTKNFNPFTHFYPEAQKAEDKEDLETDLSFDEEGYEDEEDYDVYVYENIYLHAEKPEKELLYGYNHWKNLLISKEEERTEVNIEQYHLWFQSCLAWGYVSSKEHLEDICPEALISIESRMKPEITQLESYINNISESSNLSLQRRLIVLMRDVKVRLDIIWWNYHKEDHLELTDLYFEKAIREVVDGYKYDLKEIFEEIYEASELNEKRSYDDSKNVMLFLKEVNASIVRTEEGALEINNYVDPLECSEKLLDKWYLNR